MKRWSLLLILMCLPGAALVAAWAGGRWTVSRWDADLPWIEVPPAEGEGGFADLRYAWADPTPEQRAGRLAGGVRRDTRAGYASDEDWSGEDEGWPWNENAEREREACFVLEDEIAAADCLEAVDAAVAVAPAPGEAPPTIARPPADDGRPVGTVFGPKPTRPGPTGRDAAGKHGGVDAAIDVEDADAHAAAPPPGRIDLRPTPDDPAGDAQACARAAWGEAPSDCLARLDPTEARAWLDGHAQALAAARRGLAAPQRRDPRPFGGRQPAWPELGRLLRTAVALRFLEGDQAGALAEACTLSLQWRRPLLDPGITRGRLDGLREADEAALLALRMRLAAPTLAPPAHCAQAFALPAGDGRGVGCLVMGAVMRDGLGLLHPRPGDEVDPDRLRFAARLARPYCDEGGRFDADLLAGAPLEALQRGPGLEPLAALGAPGIAFDVGGITPDRQVLRGLLDAHAQRRALHAAWTLAGEGAGGGEAGGDAATALAARLAALDPGAGGAQALRLDKSGRAIEVLLWGPNAPEAGPNGTTALPEQGWRVPFAPREAGPAAPPAPR